MKISVVDINNEKHLALYNNGKLALLNDYGINKKSLKDLNENDLPKIENINDFNEYDFKYESLIDKSSNLFLVGLNYKSHINETNEKTFNDPVIFSKANNTYCGNNNTIKIDEKMNIDYEGELCVMINRKAKNVNEDKALDYVLGYFIGNDLSSRIMQFKTPQWFIGKSFDNFYPNGPYISVNEIDNPQNLHLKTYLNDELRQSSSTENMIYSVKKLISYISKYITLERGDCISTGTPSGVIIGMPEDKRKFIKNGDNIRIEISNLGSLNNNFIS